jgi:hypothetical protein
MEEPELWRTAVLLALAMVQRTEGAEWHEIDHGADAFWVAGEFAAAKHGFPRKADKERYLAMCNDQMAIVAEVAQVLDSAYQAGILERVTRQTTQVAGLGEMPTPTGGYRYRFPTGSV